MGQLLVVRSKLPDFEVQPELIPDPYYQCLSDRREEYGSGIRIGMVSVTITARDRTLPNTDP